MDLLSVTSFKYHVTGWDCLDTLITKPLLLHESVSVQGQLKSISICFSQQKMAAMCYLEKNSLFLKQHWSIKQKELNVINIHKTRSKHTLSHFPCHIFLTIDSEHVKSSLYFVIEPVAKEHINSYHQSSTWITERFALSITR